MFLIRYTLTSLSPHEETSPKRHSIELTLILFTKVGFLKPHADHRGFEICKVSQPEFLSKHSAVCQAETECWISVRDEEAKCSLSICYRMLRAHVGSKWQNASQCFSILSVWCLTLAWRNTPTLWQIGTLINLLNGKISLLYYFSLDCINVPMSMYFESSGVPMELHRIRTYWKTHSNATLFSRSFHDPLSKPIVLILSVCVFNLFITLACLPDSNSASSCVAMN